jgi:hypothetical protein
MFPNRVNLYKLFFFWMEKLPLHCRIETGQGPGGAAPELTMGQGCFYSTMKRQLLHPKKEKLIKVHSIGKHAKNNSGFWTQFILEVA